MQLTCPTCHARHPMEAFHQDAAARELLVLVAGLDAALARALVSYIGLFRPRTTQLSWDRSLRLCREVLAMHVPQVLEAALVETLRSLEDKRAQAAWKPLSGHNYLATVIKATAARLDAGRTLAPVDGSVHEPRSAVQAPRSRAGQSLVTLQGMKRGER